MQSLDTQIYAIAEKVVRLGLTAPSILLLELLRPLSTLGYSSLVVSEPFAALALGRGRTTLLKNFLEDRQNIESLILAIEKQEKERHARN